MTPKEKAKYLVNKFVNMEDDTCFYWDGFTDTKYSEDDVLPHAKKCALICVEEVLEALPDTNYTDVSEHRPQYWVEVKTEIDLLQKNVKIMAKPLRKIIEERITNLYVAAKILKDDGKNYYSFISKAELLESILNEFDGVEI